MGKQRAIVPLSNSIQVIDAAERLLELAHLNPKEKHLPACAVVMAASALSQMIDLWLRAFAKVQAHDSGVHQDATPAGRVLMTGSQRDKLWRLFPLLSEDAVGLNGESDLVMDLEYLVTTRNRLMHIEERPAESIDVTVDGDLMTVRIPVPPPNVWFELPLDRAARVVAAAKAYITAISVSPVPDHAPDLLRWSSQ